MKIELTPENVKNFRLSKGLSQAEFAEKVGVSQATVSKAERSDEALSTKYLVKIRKAYPMKVVPAKFVKPSSWKLCKLRVRYELGLYDKAGIRPMTFDAFVRMTQIDEAAG